MLKSDMSSINMPLNTSLTASRRFAFISTRVKGRPGLPRIINGILTTTVRTAITCCLVTPAMSIYFFSMQSILSGHNIASTWEHLQHTLPQSWKSAFRYWPVVNAINFSVVPAPLRGIFQAFAGLAWQTYLAWMNQHVMGLEKTENGQRQGTEESIPESQGPMPVEC